MECLVRDIAVYYEEFGEGRPVIILHGSPGDHRYLKPSLEPIFSARGGWTRIYPDLPGVGETETREWIKSNDQLLDVLLEFIHSVIPGQSFGVIGNSYGAYIARGLVTRVPNEVDGLFLWVPAIHHPESEKPPPHTVFVSSPEVMSQLSEDEWERYVFNEVAVIQDSKSLHYIRGHLVPSFVRGQKGDDFVKVSDTNFSFPLDVEPFAKPTLILCGRQDSNVGYRNSMKILEAYPRATLVVLDRAGHLVGLSEQEELFKVLLNEWLDRVEEGTSPKSS